MRFILRFYVLIVLTLVAAVILPAVFIYVDAREDIVETLGQRQEYMAQAIRREVLLQLQNSLLLTDVMAATPAVRAYFDNMAKQEEHMSAVLEALTRASGKHAPDSYVYMLDAKGSVSFCEERVPADRRHFTVLPVAIEKLQKGLSLVSQVHFGQEESPVFLSPVVVDGEFRGAVAMVWPLSVLMDSCLVETYKESKQPLRVYIVNRDLKLIFRSEDRWITGIDISSMPVGQLVASGASGVLLYPDSLGVDRIGAMYPLSEFGWTVGVSTPLSYVDVATRALMLKGCFVACVFVGLSVLLVTLTLRRMVKKLRRHASQMDMIMQGAGMGRWDCDMIKGTFSYNARFAEVTGLLEQQAAVQPLQWLWGFIHPQDREVLSCFGGEAGRTDDFSYEFRFRQLDGSWRWLQSWGSVIKTDAAGTPFVLTGLIMDVDARKQLQYTEALQKHKLEVLVAQRTVDLERVRDEALAATEAKSFFLSTMSHEIRTPLNAVVGFIQLFERDNLRPRQIDYLTKIRTASQGLLGVINDVLDISKIEAGKLDIERVPFSLRSVVDGVCSISGFAIKDKNLSLNVVVADDVPDHLMGDPTRLHQILLNLMSNAIKFTHEGGITVNALCRAGSSQERSHGQPFMVDFSVKDSGLGMDDEQLERLFKPFSQADSTVTRKFGGTGLGLAICKQLVELMGGEISVRSTPGEGAEFTFSLCVEEAVEGADTSADTVEGPQDISSLKGALVLVVEDNIINQEIARTQLENLGLRVDLADNGQEGLELVQSKDYALVFMDMQMPVMDGLTATRRIRDLAFVEARSPKFGVLPIIAMTANAMNEDRLRCMEAGMNGHMAKPFDVEELQRVLLQWIRR